ncbi:MAG: endonuclease III [Bacteroidetes bacterium]|nr:endonuclease III [Bacteroidota bacterium]
MNRKRTGEIISRLEYHFNSAEKKNNEKKKNLLDVLIATKLSQNTTDRTSHKAFLNLKKRFKDWEEVSSAPLSDIRKEIKVCGMADTKSKDIKRMLQDMKANYGRISLEHLRRKDDPEVYGEMLKYKGIGTKTIACLLAFGMERPAFPVDTHVHRVLNRMGIVDTKTPEQTFETAKDIVPDDNKVGFHVNLIKLGRSICKAAAPLCGECPVYSLCGFGEKKFYRDNNKSAVKENNFIILENL